MSETEKSEAKVIRRYQNRKLYDTERSCYVTLDEIAKMIKNGVDVQVIDNKTKKDITSTTLVQIMFENEKKAKKMLPIDTMKEFIQIGGGSISKFLQKGLKTGVDSLSTAKEEAERVIDSVVGKALNKAGLPSAGIDDIQKKVDQTIRGQLGKIVNFDETQKMMREIISKLETLENKVRRYEEERENKSSNQTTGGENL